ncbi:hypothetical protein D9M70_596930 [compost metagenome]
MYGQRGQRVCNGHLTHLCEPHLRGQASLQMKRKFHLRLKRHGSLRRKAYGGRALHRKRFRRQPLEIRVFSNRYPDPVTVAIRQVFRKEKRKSGFRCAPQQPAVFEISIAV